MGQADYRYQFTFLTTPPPGGFFMSNNRGKTMTEETESENLEVHVAVCAERYKSLSQRLDRIEKIVWWSSTMMMTGMGGVIIKLVTLKGAL